MEVAADIHPIQNPSVANDAAGGDADKRTAWMVKYISKGFQGKADGGCADKSPSRTLSSHANIFRTGSEDENDRGQVQCG